MTVRSKQLGHNTAIANTGSVIYTVPTGHVTIVRSILIQNNAGAANRVIVRVEASGVDVFSRGVTVGAAAGTAESMALGEWFVMSAGQSLKITPAASFVAALASGAELQL